jgi:hypothetical protein
MSPVRAFHESIDLPREAVDRYNHIFFIRNFFQMPALFVQEMKALERELVQALPPLEDDVRPIETYEPGQIDSESLKAMYRETVRPIVIKGFAAEHECVKRWTPEFFKENYGDFRIFYSSTENLVNDDGTRLGDFVDGVLAGNKNRAYVENLSDIFNTYPELHRQAGLDRVHDFLGGFASYHRIAQLFIGGPGTGAVFHCANELNCFLNIHGRKEWTFVHPKYAAAMYSTNFNKGFFVGSFVKHNASKRFLEAEYPLYNRVPKLRYTLEPGDMLINPPWWWHAINNVTPSTISVASRWEILTENTRQNLAYDYVQSLRKDRLTIVGKKLAPTDIVVPDTEIRKNYITYKQMGWEASR